MCLGVPGEIREIDDSLIVGRVRVGGIDMPVNLLLTPHAAVGDFVMVHAGTALKTMDADSVSYLMEFAAAAGDRRDRMTSLAGRIHSLAHGLGLVRLMEVCGTHTVAIARSGLKSLLPDNIDLVSGPGCPVCVTPTAEIDAAIDLAINTSAHIVTFGDMLRVPGSGGTLESARLRGAKITVVYSPDQALDLADEAEEHVIFLAVGFETTAPVIAATLKSARARGIDNFSTLVNHRLIPPALEALLGSGRIELDGLICPGHVSTVIGYRAYDSIASAYKLPAVVAGFDPIDVMESIEMILEQIAGGEAFAANQYRRGVSADGSPQARWAIEEVFEIVDGRWRGLGVIPDSALKIRPEWRRFDAAVKFDLEIKAAPEPPGCRCGDVLSGRIKPAGCGLLGSKCLPDMPVGPCMVSSEGPCRAAYTYPESDRPQSVAP